MHFYGWKKGLKTGMYYLRTRPAAQAIQFTVDQTALKTANQAKTELPANGHAEARVNGGAKSPTAATVHTPTSISTPAPAKRAAAAVAAAISAAATASPSVVSDATEPPASPTTSHYASPISTPIKSVDPEPLSLDGGAAKVVDPEYAAALRRQKEREEAEAKLLCSLENKEACLMCSG